MWAFFSIYCENIMYDSSDYAFKEWTEIIEESLTIDGKYHWS